MDSPSSVPSTAVLLCVDGTITVSDRAAASRAAAIMLAADAAIAPHERMLWDYQVTAELSPALPHTPTTLRIAARVAEADPDALIRQLARALGSDTRGDVVATRPLAEGSDAWPVTYRWRPRHGVLRIPWTLRPDLNAAVRLTVDDSSPEVSPHAPSAPR